MTQSRPETDVLTLPIRGARDYLQGADILTAMLRWFGSCGNGLTFSVHDMIRSDRLRMHPVDTAAELGRFPIRLNRGDGLLLAGAPQKHSAHPERLPDHEVEIWGRARLQKESNMIKDFSPLHPLGMAVSLKKQMMLDRLGPDFGKWTFCKLVATRALPERAESIAVQYLRGSRNIHVSTVLFDGAEHGQITFMAN